MEISKNDYPSGATIKRFRYNFFGKYNDAPSSCIVKIFSEKGKHFICFDEEGNEGVSVTNASEQLATEIVNKMDYDPDDCRFFELYQETPETFAEITYNWEYKDDVDHRGLEYIVMFEASNPKWKPGSRDFRILFLSQIYV
jgi:hypothetical protein